MKFFKYHHEKEEEKLELEYQKNHIHNIDLILFTKILLNNSKDIDSESVNIINNNFWDIVN